MARLFFITWMIVIGLLFCGTRFTEAAEQNDQPSISAQNQNNNGKSGAFPKVTVQEQRQTEKAVLQNNTSQPSGYDISLFFIVAIIILVQIIIQMGMLLLDKWYQNTDMIQQPAKKEPETDPQLSFQLEQILIKLNNLERVNNKIQDSQRKLSLELDSMVAYIRTQDTIGEEGKNTQTFQDSSSFESPLLQNPKIQKDISRWKAKKDVFPNAQKICLMLNLMELIGKNSPLVSGLLYYLSYPLISCVEADDLSPVECQKELEQWARILHQQFDTYEILIPRINASVDSSWMNSPNKAVKVTRITSWGIRNQDQKIEQNATVK